MNGEMWDCLHYGEQISNQTFEVDGNIIEQGLYKLNGEIYSLVRCNTYVVFFNKLV
jgi:hypothetical protein